MPTTAQHPLLSTMRILWGALFATNGMYAAALVATNKAEAVAPGPDSALITVMAFTATLLAVLSVVLPRTMSRRGAAGSMPATREDQSYTDQGDRGFRDTSTAAATRESTDPEVAEDAAFRSAVTPFILGMALAESIAICGFLLGFLGGGLRLAAPFFAACAALQAVRFPTRAGVLARYEEAVGTRFPRG